MCAKQTATVMWGIIAVLASAASVPAVPAEVEAIAGTMPEREVDLLLAAGREYGLTGPHLQLLFAIRKVENGGPGIEMGVGSDIDGHPARRFAGDSDRSLLLQARWAAGTIKKRYTGDMNLFARRYCPPNWLNWQQMVEHWINRAG